MKYIKGDQIGAIDSYIVSKISLSDGEGFSEYLWIGLIPNTDQAVLKNHALAFTPHESWGAIVPARSFNFLEMLKKQELTLHPSAWDKYIENDIIDSEGNHIEK
jgi:hypothetical protein